MNLTTILIKSDIKRLNRKKTQRITLKFKLFFDKLIKIPKLLRTYNIKKAINKSFISFTITEYSLKNQRSNTLNYIVFQNLFTKLYLIIIEIFKSNKQNEIKLLDTNYLRIPRLNTNIQDQLTKLYSLVFAHAFCSIKIFKTWQKMNCKKIKMITKRIIHNTNHQITSFTFYRCTSKTKRITRFLDYRSSN
ncbi:hypothetical protein BNATCHR2104 (nucleomorph) [Bigelowiella natans]|uniref:Uncharacterized protein n=1 Tax=Bigelowiella natans TaxID=227086 RepID=Q3LW53_BIGNA|nr:hypothetical protein BNATCHR2104 [Bigelowiella natans]ABA27312.1 hypothetical protein [Bigelowiella natans]